MSGKDSRKEIVHYTYFSTSKIIVSINVLQVFIVMSWDMFNYALNMFHDNVCHVTGNFQHNFVKIVISYEIAKFKFSVLNKDRLYIHWLTKQTKKL